jgi:hypothetical protein
LDEGLDFGLNGAKCQQESVQDFDLDSGMRGAAKKHKKRKNRDKGWRPGSGLSCTMRVDRYSFLPPLFAPPASFCGQPSPVLGFNVAVGGRRRGDGPGDGNRAVLACGTGILSRNNENQGVGNDLGDGDNDFPV